METCKSLFYSLSWLYCALDSGRHRANLNAATSLSLCGFSQQARPLAFTVNALPPFQERRQRTAWKAKEDRDDNLFHWQVSMQAVVAVWKRVQTGFFYCMIIVLGNGGMFYLFQSTKNTT